MSLSNSHRQKETFLSLCHTCYLCTFRIATEILDCYSTKAWRPKFFMINNNLLHASKSDCIGRKLSTLLSITGSLSSSDAMAGLR